MADYSAEFLLRKLSKAVEVIRIMDATLPIQTFSAFLAVAIEEGQTISSIGQKVDIAQSSASRNISALSDWDWKKKEGLKLVEYRTDPMNLSIKQVFLTARGQKVRDQIVNVLRKEQGGN